VTAMDETFAFLRKPYDFISEGCERRGSDVFETRLMLRPTICMMGREAAELFYDDSHFVRHGAAPMRIQQSLRGHGGVQALDGEAHQRRKRMFLEMTGPERVAQLLEIAERQWLRAAQRWQERGEIVLYDELHELLTRAVCQWAGVPLAEREVARRVHELTAVFDHAGAVGPAHWSARGARHRAERWLGALVADVRSGNVEPEVVTALSTVAWHRDADGALLTTRTAAVELLNVLRPTVAVSVFIVFAAVALHRHPHLRARVRRDERPIVDQFVQEVRRYYPLFPAAMARAREDFTWHGQRFRRGERVMLDLHGTNHDVRHWIEPREFRPDRFAGPPPDAFDFVPQGGGTYDHHHRCPGEEITVALMKQAVRFLLRRLAFTWPPQDLEIDRTRLPALPRSRVVLSDVRLVR
ncbi:MAG TPA: cytochrome P450, partial [Steroidobacteraceae bacterium]